MAEGYLFETNPSPIRNRGHTIEPSPAWGEGTRGDSGALWPSEANQHLGQTKPRGGNANLRLQETIAGSAPLFQDCYLQWMAQLQRVEPSARGPPISRLSERRPVFFPVIYRSGRAAFGGIGGRPRFPRARRRDSMPTERKPRTAMSTQTIIVERRGRVGIVRLNRPQALNALNVTLKNELLGAVEALDADANVGCILMTGSDKAFAAGADIK